ncbi:hypothetical protein E3N88_37764 [Mikania micrantha]|uniref:Uncharacterized protein n=1 Tax=Mikania micrantha TaxID=192012 RepID=A0A5N6LS00_9ASTR|nr:hypothetical protein E3N88_37764 [Mikania micrantha]
MKTWFHFLIKRKKGRLKTIEELEARPASGVFRLVSTTKILVMLVTAIAITKPARVLFHFVIHRFVSTSFAAAKFHILRFKLRFVFAKSNGQWFTEGAFGWLPWFTKTFRMYIMTTFGAE